jgi:hypothetical protein
MVFVLLELLLVQGTAASAADAVSGLFSELLCD